METHRFSRIFLGRDASRVRMFIFDTPGVVEESIRIARRQALEHGVRFEPVQLLGCGKGERSALTSAGADSHRDRSQRS